MTCVGDVMTRSVVAVRKDAQFKDIVQVMRARRFSAFPVLDDDSHVIGVVSEDDLLVRLAMAEPVAGLRFVSGHADRAKATGLTAAELMSKPAITIRADAAIADAARTMHAKHLKRLPVVTSDGRLVGVVSRVDLLGEYDRPDSDIRTEVIKRVIESEFLLDRFAFTVTVESGIVTLAGPVDSEAVAVSLLAEVRRVVGVVAVRDRLRYPRH